MKTVLTIAGYDPSSGAGITHDMDVFQSFGLHGVSAPTCIIVQGPKGVEHLHPLPINQFRQIVRKAETELSLHGVKIGVVCDEAYVMEIESFLKKKKSIPVVIDTVFAAKNGVKLITGAAMKALTERLFPLAAVVTPNIDEASIICGKTVRTVQDMKKAAKHILALGAGSVIVKGGHLKGDPTDVLYDGNDFTLWNRKRTERVVHGTGCLFSSLIASLLVLGYKLREAFIEAEKEMEKMLTDSYAISKSGYFYTSMGIGRSLDAERWNVIRTLQETGEQLCTFNPVELIPEVQMNFGYAVKGATQVSDVAAFPGRIGKHKEKIIIKSGPLFNASSHVARMILACMHYYPEMRACVNVRYHDAFIHNAKTAKMKVLMVSRIKEPGNIRKKEGKSLDFLVDKALRGTSEPPDIIYDKGSSGKEPMIRIFARNPEELLKKMEIIRL